MTIFIAIVGLGFLILVHELGHFTASLALGMRPRRFYIGFPPAILKTTRNGIEYGLGAIPLGGFVKIPGMHRPAPVDVDAGLSRALHEEPALSGAAGRLRNALAAGDHDAARDSLRVLGELVDERELTPATEASARRALDDLNDALGPDAYWRAPTWKRVTAIAAGPAANILLALVLFTGLYMTSVGKATTTVEEISQNSPAAVDGAAAGRPDRLDRRRACRGGRRLRDHLRLRGTAAVGRRRPRRRGGDASADRSEAERRRVPAGLHPRRRRACRCPRPRRSPSPSAWRVTREIGASLGRLVQGDGRDDIASPVGIVQGSSEAAKQGTETFLFVLGLISLSIALLNLLPLLPLDGGHIVFAIAEGVARADRPPRDLREGLGGRDWASSCCCSSSG